MLAGTQTPYFTILRFQATSEGRNAAHTSDLVRGVAMDLTQLEHFVRVAEVGSFTRAALMLGVPQSSLSRHIRALEVQLRHTLLHRNGRGVELTTAGNCLLKHGSVILETARRALGELDDLRVAPRGRVVLGLPTRVANALTKILVQAFRQQFPEASISVAEGGSALLHEWLTLGRVDIALLFDPPHAAELDVELVHSEELVLVGPRMDGGRLPACIPFTQLANYPLILPRVPNATRTVVATAAARHRVELNVCVEVDTTANILDLVAARLGYAILSRAAVSAVGGQDRYSISKIQAPVLYNRLYIATNRHRMQTRLVEELRKVIKKVDVSSYLRRPGSGISIVQHA